MLGLDAVRSTTSLSMPVFYQRTAAMGMPCLPAYRGHKNVWLITVRKQQRQLRDAHLSVPDDHQLGTQCEYGAAAPKGQLENVQPALPTTGIATFADALNLISQEGVEPAGLAAVSRSMPRSKLDKQSNKQASHLVMSMLEPALLALRSSSTTAADVAPLQARSRQALKALEATSLEDITQFHLQAFCSWTCNEAQSPSTDQPAGECEEVILHEPEALEVPQLVNPDWLCATAPLQASPDISKDGSWFWPSEGKEAFWQQTPNIPLTPGSCDALIVKVDCLQGFSANAVLQANRSLASVAGLLHQWAQQRSDQVKARNTCSTAPAAALAATPPAAAAAVPAAAAASKSLASVGPAESQQAAVPATEVPELSPVYCKAAGAAAPAAAAPDMNSAKSSSVAVGSQQDLASVSTTMHGLAAQSASNPADIGGCQLQQSGLLVAELGNAGEELLLHDSQQVQPLLEEPMLQFGWLLQQGMQPPPAAAAVAAISSEGAISSKAAVNPDHANNSAGLVSFQELRDHAEAVLQGYSSSSSSGSTNPAALDGGSCRGSLSTWLPVVPEQYVVLEFPKIAPATREAAGAAAAAASHASLHNAVKHQQVSQAQCVLLLPVGIAAALLPNSPLSSSSSSHVSSICSRTTNLAVVPVTPVAGSVDAANTWSNLQSATKAVVMHAMTVRSKKNNATGPAAEMQVETTETAPSVANTSTGLQQQQQQQPSMTEVQQEQLKNVRGTIGQQDNTHGTTAADKLAAMTAITEQKCRQIVAPAAARQLSQLDNATAATAAGATQADAAASNIATAVPSDQQDTMQLSPTDMLIEVPVCGPDSKAPRLLDMLLADAIDAAQLVLGRSALTAATTRVATAQAGGQQAAAAGSASDKQQLRWVAALTGLEQQKAALHGTDGIPWYATAAFDALLSGIAFDYYKPNIIGSDSTETAAVTSTANTGSEGAVPSGAALLENMLAADMQPKESNIMLPVTLFANEAAGWNGGWSASDTGDEARGSTFKKLLHSGSYTKQSTAHLELYFDWSATQPWEQDGTVGKLAAADDPATAPAAGSIGQKRRRSSTIIGSTAALDVAGVVEAPTCAQNKRIRHNASTAMAAAADADQHVCKFDMAAWLQACSQLNGLYKLQQLITSSRLASGVATAAASGSSSDASPLSKCSWQKVLLRTQRAQVTNSSGCSAAINEDMPPAVAAAAAKWLAVHNKSNSAAASGAQAATVKQGAVVATPAAAAAGWPAGLPARQPHHPQQQPVEPQSDMEFFLQLQQANAAATAGLAANKRKRRHGSIVQGSTLQAVNAAAAAAKLAVNEQAAADGAAAGVSGRMGAAVSDNSTAPAAAAKRAKIAAAAGVSGSASERNLAGMHVDADSGTEAVASIDAPPPQQQQQQLPDDTTELALNGATRTGTATACASADDKTKQTGQQQQHQLVQPVLLDVQLSAPLLQLLLALQHNRHAILSAMQCPGPQLVSCKLWNDAAAQALLCSYQAAGPLTPEHKQEAKHAVGLLLLSQAAACLVHYGVRVAHLFMQHSLQRLPTIAALCRDAATALKAAYKAVETGSVNSAVRLQGTTQQGAPSAACSNGGSGAAVECQDHPKLVQLQQLLHRVNAADQVLLVSESKSFFSLYHTLSAAGMPAVQLDRQRQLLASGPTIAAEEEKASDAAAAAGDGAAVVAWQTAVQKALSLSRCVLVTHEHLYNPCMPYQLFDILLEYVAFADTAAAASSSSVSIKDTGSKCNSPTGNITAIVDTKQQNGEAAADRVFTRQHMIAAHFAGRHFVLCSLAPCSLEEAAVAAAGTDARHQEREAAVADDAATMLAAGSQTAGITATSAAAATATERPPSAPIGTQHGAGKAGDNGIVASSTAEAASAQAGTAAATTIAAVELPLVLNRGPKSLLRRRQSLYEALLLLEQQQHYSLVERSVMGVTVAAAVVDVVLSPAGCICVWDSTRLPQETNEALEVLSKSLISLSMSYDTIFYVLELPEALLQVLLKAAGPLQALAVTAGVKLQVLGSFMAANTQDMLTAICETIPRSFWAGSNGGKSGSGSSSSTHQPPSISDIPSVVEAFWAGCIALNPMSAAVLASHKLPLRAVIDRVVAGQTEGLAAGIPIHSMQLLATQITAIHLQLNLSPESLVGDRAAQQPQWQQQQHMQLEQAEGDHVQHQLQQQQQQHCAGSWQEAGRNWWQQQQAANVYTLSPVQQEQCAQDHGCPTSPNAAAFDGCDINMNYNSAWKQHRHLQQQQQMQNIQSRQGRQRHCHDDGQNDMVDNGMGTPSNMYDAAHTGRASQWQDTYMRADYLPKQQHAYGQRLQQRQEASRQRGIVQSQQQQHDGVHADAAAQVATRAAGIDPSGILDAFLHSRIAPGTAAGDCGGYAAARHRAMTSRQQHALRHGQPHHSAAPGSLRQQRRQQAMGNISQQGWDDSWGGDDAAAARLVHEDADAPGRPAMHQIEPDLPDIALPFATDFDMPKRPTMNTKQQHQRSNMQQHRSITPQGSMGDMVDAADEYWDGHMVNCAAAAAHGGRSTNLNIAYDGQPEWEDNVGLHRISAIHNRRVPATNNMFGMAAAGTTAYPVTGLLGVEHSSVRKPSWHSSSAGGQQQQKQRGSTQAATALDELIAGAAVELSGGSREGFGNMFDGPQITDNNSSIQLAHDSLGYALDENQITRFFDDRLHCRSMQGGGSKVSSRRQQQHVANSSSSTGLFSEAFMPHHKPTKQLKYTKNAGAVGFGSNSRGFKGHGRKGKQQAKLYFG